MSDKTDLSNEFDRQGEPFDDNQPQRRQPMTPDSLLRSLEGYGYRPIGNDPPKHVLKIHAENCAKVEAAMEAAKQEGRIEAFAFDAKLLIDEGNKTPQVETIALTRKKYDCPMPGHVLCEDGQTRRDILPLLVKELAWIDELAEEAKRANAMSKMHGAGMSRATQMIREHVLSVLVLEAAAALAAREGKQA